MSVQVFLGSYAMRPNLRRFFFLTFTFVHFVEPSCISAVESQPLLLSYLWTGCSLFCKFVQSSGITLKADTCGWTVPGLSVLTSPLKSVVELLCPSFNFSSS